MGFMSTEAFYASAQRSLSYCLHQLLQDRFSVVFSMQNPVVLVGQWQEAQSLSIWSTLG